MVTFSMTYTDPYAGFHGHGILKSIISKTVCLPDKVTIAR